MKVIPQTRHSHYIIYLRFYSIFKHVIRTRSFALHYISYYFYFTMSVPDEGYSTNTSFALHYISSFLFLFYYERTWWRLFHKHVIRTTLYIFVSIFILLWLMKVIPQTRHSHYISYLRFYFYFTMSVPDEGYSTNTSFAYIIYLRFYFYFTMSVPDEGYSNKHVIRYYIIYLVSTFLFYYERSWWRLFQKHVILTLAIFVSIFILLWAYLMKVIPQTRHSHYISYLRFYFYFTMSVPDEGYSTNTSFATLYIFVSIFILLWAYLMKVIPQTRHSNYIIYLRFYFYFTMSVPDEGYSTNTSFTLH